MYTQTHRIKGPPKQDGAHNLAALADEKGFKEHPVHRLLSQSGAQVTFCGPDGEVEAMPSDEFFATHREAGPADVERYEAGTTKKSAKAPA